MADLNSAIWVYLKSTVGLAGVDTNSMLRKQADSLTTGDLNQKIKAIILLAGSAN